MPDSNARIPVRPLSIENSNIAVAKELIVDYKGGSVFVKTEDGKLINCANSKSSIEKIYEVLQSDATFAANQQINIFDSESGEYISENMGSLIGSLKDSAQKPIILDDGNQVYFTGKNIIYDRDNYKVYGVSVIRTGTCAVGDIVAEFNIGYSDISITSINGSAEYENGAIGTIDGFRIYATNQDNFTKITIVNEGIAIYGAFIDIEFIQQKIY